MRHIYQENQFGEDWFNYSNFYKNIVKKFNSESIFVEVGCWKGKSSAFMAVEIANSKKNIKFYCVDHWLGSQEHHDPESDTFDPNIHNLYETFIQNMSPLKDYYQEIKMDSVQASQQFRNKSLDFVFLDASHKYNDVVSDIQSWLPKIKNNGVLAGHDYGCDLFDVTEVVNKLLPRAKIDLHQNIWYYENKNNFKIIY